MWWMALTGYLNPINAISKGDKVGMASRYGSNSYLRTSNKGLRRISYVNLAVEPANSAGWPVAA